MQIVNDKIEYLLYNKVSSGFFGSILALNTQGQSLSPM